MYVCIYVIDSDSGSDPCIKYPFIHSFIHFFLSFFLHLFDVPNTTSGIEFVWHKIECVTYHDSDVLTL